MREVAAALSGPRSSARERYYTTPGLPTTPSLPGQRDGAEPVEDCEHEIADEPDVHAGENARLVPIRNPFETRTTRRVHREDRRAVPCRMHDGRTARPGENPAGAASVQDAAARGIAVSMVVAARAGDMLSELTLATTAGLGLGAIANTIHPYRTQAEVMKKGADAYNRTRLTPTVKKLFAWWLGLSR